MVRFGNMSYSDQTPPSPSRGSSSNSGAQYATATLGVGLIALGIVMIVWSVVPSGSAGNSSRPGMESSQVRDTSSVAFVLVGGGIALLLLSVCLSIRNKRRAARGQEASNTPANAQERAMAEQLAQSYMVPSYEEVVESGQYPISQSSVRNNSTTQLPAYEELVEHQLALEDGSNQARRHSSQTDPSSGEGGRRKSRPGSKLIPLKMRRFKSENMRRKSLSDAPQSYVFTIEPLTPPPHYDDEPPPLLTNTPQ
ncbi:transmembrane protein 51a [Xyrauchen texanus]|uniref:transmembrane protein 51a n=1 Tax=Xyrauchen texanus TaxID=154827 RepID=UPI002242ADCD|nr:transmembrane protein 51a [Xyrauchen texanus]XP_051951130.1 transmembrane protein 51a [Xyrauchen texanus]XP_051951131.1 transmembrane protein 51a [Xyrauchen texanus]